MAKANAFKILSIDGGGVKGLYSSIILQHLEEEFCEKQGTHLSDHFDMICGTSTGGLIALALAIKTPVSEITKLYKTKGKVIFPNVTLRQKTINSFKKIFWKGKYENKGLKNELKTFFNDKTMSNSKNLLCIPSFNLTTGQPTVWKFPHKEGKYVRDGKVPMLDVALSTSAAPTYFPIHEISPHGQFIDGGVWANNPTLCGILEAIEFFLNKPIINSDFQYDTIEVLSVSSINTPIAQKINKNLNKSFLGWKDKIFHSFFEGQSHFSDRFIKNAILKIYPKSQYHRVSSPVLAPEHAKVIDLDKVNDTSLLLIETLGNQVGNDYRSAKRAFVEPFFQTLKTYKTN